MSLEWLIDEDIKFALRNIEGYINELNGKVEDEVIQRLKYYYEQTKLNQPSKRFNLVYINSNGDIIKICNEKFIYEYTKNAGTFYRIRTDIEGEKPFVYPPERVKENKAQEDLEIMQSSQVLYVNR